MVSLLDWNPKQFQAEKAVNSRLGAEWSAEDSEWPASGQCVLQVPTSFSKASQALCFQKQPFLLIPNIFIL